MKKILFVNACPRTQSRTLELAAAVLERLEGEIREIRVFDEEPCGLTRETLALRDRLAAEKKFDHEMFDLAKEFARADEIVIAAPYWDLMFPAALRGYLEAVTVSGISFVYSSSGVPQGLCRANRLIYVTTSGGPIFRNFGYEYVEALAHAFYGIQDTRCIHAQGLDIWGTDVQAVLQKAKQEIAL